MAEAQTRLDCVHTSPDGLTHTLVCTVVPASIPPAPPKPQPVNCQGLWGAWAPVAGPSGQFGACVLDVSGQWRQSRSEERKFAVTIPAANGGTACPASPESRVFVQACTPPTPPPPPIPPPPSGGSLFGVADPLILGDYTAAEHDVWAVDGGDGFRYRTWHPQCPVIQNGQLRCFAHEHGDDPGQIDQADIAASLKSAPLAFGYIGRRMNGHEEAHEGFKVFTAKRGQCNDEGRCNLTDSLSVFHMGTGGPKRFITRDHSNDLRYWNPDSGFVHTRLMMDTGDFDNVCDPRHDEPTKDGFSLPNRCMVNSGYEIWTTSRELRRLSGEVIGRPRAVPAVFDPVTVFDRANPGAVVYAWDERFKPFRNHPGDDWTGNRGCERESYAQVGNFWNDGGPTRLYTDVMGQEVPQSNPLGIWQVIPAKEIVDHRSSTARPGELLGNQAFKLRKDYCGNKAKLGLKN